MQHGDWLASHYNKYPEHLAEVAGHVRLGIHEESTKKQAENSGAYFAGMSHLLRHCCLFILLLQLPAFLLMDMRIAILQFEVLTALVGHNKA